MQKASILVSATISLLLLPGISLAATHVVTVGDNFFDPNDLTIQPGDTVQFNNPAGGAPHDVTADDFSWASITASSFVYERVFNNPGEVLYHCTVHSSPGQNRNTNMNGRITIQAEQEDFLINAGLNDAWFNPATEGQGFFITVFPDIQKMFLAWFTYDTQRPLPDVEAILGEPGHRWLTAFGSYSGDEDTLNVELTEGGVFDSANPAVTQSPDGTIEVYFTGCNAGMVKYEINSPNISGQIPIERISLDNVPVCEALATP